MNLKDILEASPSTEPATFKEFVNALPDVPDKGDKEGWGEVFRLVRTAEQNGYVDVERDSNSRMESIQLTGNGIEKLRFLREQR